MFEDLRDYRFNMFALHYTFECGTCYKIGNFTILDLMLYLCQFVIILMLVGYIVVIVTVKCGAKRSVKARKQGTRLVNSFY